MYTQCNWIISLALGDKLLLWGQICPLASFYMAYKLRKFILCLRNCKKGKQSKTKEYVTESAGGPWSLRYLPSGPLQRRFTTPTPLYTVLVITDRIQSIPKGKY